MIVRPRVLRRLVTATFPLALTLTMVLPAFADSVSARAQQLKKQGDAAMDSLHYDDALASYKAAYEMGHDPAVLYNMAQVRRARGEYAEALDALEAFDNGASPELHARVPKLASLLDELREKVTTVTIRCDVQGAKVVVRGHDVGTSPFPTPIRVNSGKATFEITHDGYEPWKKEIDLEAGGVATVDARLDEKDTRAFLIVKSAGIVARVFIDGRRAGIAPVETQVAPGTHAVLVSADGYADAETNVVVKPGEHHDVDVPLKPESSIVTRWWFWTGIGVVVAGGVVLTASLLSSRGPDSGNGFQPSRFTAPASYTPFRW